MVAMTTPIASGFLPGSVISSRTFTSACTAIAKHFTVDRIYSLWISYTHFFNLGDE